MSVSPSRKSKINATYELAVNCCVLCDSVLKIQMYLKNVQRISELTLIARAFLFNVQVQGLSKHNVRCQKLIELFWVWTDDTNDNSNGFVVEPVAHIDWIDWYRGACCGLVRYPTRRRKYIFHESLKYSIVFWIIIDLCTEQLTAATWRNRSLLWKSHQI